MNEKERLLSFLGIARKAQRLSMGADAAKESLQKGKARLVLLAGICPPVGAERARRGGGIQDAGAFRRCVNGRNRLRGGETDRNPCRERRRFRRQAEGDAGERSAARHD